MGDQGVPDRQPAALDAGLHGADLDRGDHRDLLVRKAFDVAQQERGPLLSRQRPKSRFNERKGLAVSRELIEVGSGSGRLRPRHFVIFRRFERKLRSAFSRAEMVQSAIGRDAKEPRAEREALERSDRSPSREERILHHILGIRRGADDAQGVPIERSLLSSREIFECSRVAPARALDEELNIAVRSRAQRALSVRSRFRIR